MWMAKLRFPRICTIVLVALDIGVVDEADQIALAFGLGRRTEEAAHVLVAAVVATAAVAVEEAILIDRVLVVAGDAGRERAFVVVERAGAFGIEAVDQAVAVVVLAVRALRTAGGTGAVERRRVDEDHRSIAAGAGVIAGAVTVVTAAGGEDTRERD